MRRGHEDPQGQRQPAAQIELAALAAVPTAFFRDEPEPCYR